MGLFIALVAVIGYTLISEYYTAKKKNEICRKIVDDMEKII